MNPLISLRLLSLVLLLVPLSFSVSPVPLFAKQGIVVTDDLLASRVGVSILKAGGNAFDSAVATALVLGVTHPHSSGIGGGDFILFYHQKSSRVQVIDAREVAPAAITQEHYYRNGKHDTALSQTGGLAVAVPGELRGLYFLHSRWGVLPWKTVVAPAVRLAREGFPVSPYFHSLLKKNKLRFLKFPYLKKVFYSQGKVPEVGHLLVQPALAMTLDLIANDGVQPFYEGAIALEIVKTVKNEGGVISLQDLKRLRPRVIEPLQSTYRDYEIFTMPPPSSGGLVLLEMLHVMQNFPLKDWGHNASKTIHYVAETMKHAYADRAKYMGDDRFVSIPHKRLLSKGYARRILKNISNLTVKNYESYGRSYVGDDGGTTHFSIMDRLGNSVGVTATINTYFGSKLVVEKYGIILNNEMDDFSLAPGVQNAYGLIGSKANAIAPFKKPLSSMTPTFIMKKGKPFMMLGGSGGPRIITGVLQVISNVVDHKMNIQEAVNAPRFHHQWVPDTLYLEKEIPVDVRANLLKRGQVVRRLKARNVIQAILVGEDGIFGASDPRKQGSPAGY
jgi:gamma-glutamyltranspeptidase / glutathione hydrolase